MFTEPHNSDTTPKVVYFQEIEHLLSKESYFLIAARTPISIQLLFTLRQHHQLLILTFLS